jgi:hypothetical protein
MWPPDSPVNRGGALAALFAGDLTDSLAAGRLIAVKVRVVPASSRRVLDRFATAGRPLGHAR